MAVIIDDCRRDDYDTTTIVEMLIVTHRWQDDSAVIPFTRYRITSVFLFLEFENAVHGKKFSY